MSEFVEYVLIPMVLMLVAWPVVVLIEQSNKKSQQQYKADALRQKVRDREELKTIRASEQIHAEIAHDQKMQQLEVKLIKAKERARIQKAIELGRLDEFRRNEKIKAYREKYQGKDLDTLFSSEKDISNRIDSMEFEIELRQKESKPTTEMSEILEDLLIERQAIIDVM